MTGRAVIAVTMYLSMHGLMKDLWIKCCKECGGRPNIPMGDGAYVCEACGATPEIFEHAALGEVGWVPERVAHAVAWNIFCGDERMVAYSHHLLKLDPIPCDRCLGALVSNERGRLSKGEFIHTHITSYYCQCGCKSGPSDPDMLQAIRLWNAGERV